MLSDTMPLTFSRPCLWVFGFFSPFFFFFLFFSSLFFSLGHGIQLSLCSTINGSEKFLSDDRKKKGFTFNAKSEGEFSINKRANSRNWRRASVDVSWEYDFFFFFFWGFYQMLFVVGGAEIKLQVRIRCKSEYRIWKSMMQLCSHTLYCSWTSNSL